MCCLCRRSLFHRPAGGNAHWITAIRVILPLAVWVAITLVSILD
eukprot:COSAG05_NODE_12239_length_475_cov_0.533156_1_plen_43_part_01